jgi:hypothetical protein
MSDLHPRVYWTSDRSALVEEGDARAAFLAYASADPILPEHLALLQTRAESFSDEIEHDLYGTEDDAPTVAPVAVPALPAPVPASHKTTSPRHPRG